MEQKHVFISYVRENLAQVQHLCNDLTKLGIKVWLDKNDIEPGTRWRQAIRRAIKQGNFFIACFSLEYNARHKSFMNTELTLAIDELRQRPGDQAWFIPVKLSDCDIPDRDIGGGETLQDIQWVELYEDWNNGIQRIIKVIRPIIVTDNVEMVKIPAGEFQMGSDDGRDDEKPIHTVYVDEFYMDVYPVTNAQYRKFIEATRYREPIYWDNAGLNQSNQPVIGVTWYDAMAYAEWAGKRLPTEAEWEKAGRGGLMGKKYPWSDEAPDDKKANFGENVGKTTSVGSYPPNGYGLYDMAGNVWEWCLDEYQGDFYQNSSRNNPLADGNISDLLISYKNIATLRVLRGGSWLLDPGDIRVARRDWDGPDAGFDGLGFRGTSPRFP